MICFVYLNYFPVNTEHLKVTWSTGQWWKMISLNTQRVKSLFPFYTKFYQICKCNILS